MSRLWLERYKDKSEYGRFVPAAEVFFGPYMKWVAVTAGEAHAIVGWGFDVVFTTTNREQFFAAPETVKDARVASKIAAQEDHVRLRNNW